jgi:hypothetical protein
MAHDQEIVGSNPDIVYWMDVSNASYYIKEKFKIKIAKWGTPKKILSVIILISYQCSGYYKLKYYF